MSNKKYRRKPETIEKKKQDDDGRPLPESLAKSWEEMISDDPKNGYYDMVKPVFYAGAQTVIGLITEAAKDGKAKEKVQSIIGELDEYHKTLVAEQAADTKLISDKIVEDKQQTKNPGEDNGSVSTSN